MYFFLELLHVDKVPERYSWLHVAVSFRVDRAACRGLLFKVDKQLRTLRRGNRCTHSPTFLHVDARLLKLDYLYKYDIEEAGLNATF